MKSKLNNRGYIIYKNKFHESELKKIRKELNVQPYTPFRSKFAPPNNFPVYLEGPNKMYLPKYWALKRFGEPDKYDINPGIDINVEFKGKTRDLQNKAIDSYFNNYKSEHYNGAILVAGCGFGKTIIALKIISMISKKTLVVCHKTFLVDQWIERIKEFLPNASIGRIQQNKFEVEGKDICIAMLQTLAMRKFPDNAFDCFGLSIFDESHHLSSEIFSQALPKVGTKYTLALTATPQRADNLTKVFEWYLGKICIKLKRDDKQKTFVKILKYKSTDEHYTKLEEGFEGRIITSRMINNVVEYKPRLNLMVTEITKVMEEPGRFMIVLSDRREHLDKLDKKLNKKLGDKFCIGQYVGGMKQNDLDKTAENCHIILSTFNMASEALDIPKLNTLFLSTPKSNIIQSMGRILRVEHKIIPLIIDINDDFMPFNRQTKKRITHYKKAKYNFKEFDIYDNEENNNDKYSSILDKIKNCHINDVSLSSSSVDDVILDIPQNTTKPKKNNCEILSSSDDE
jgi:superfamily II DNA or RNA helicase